MPESITATMRREANERRLARDPEACCARLHHGPGHQSTTYCEETGSHERHKCVYGEFNQAAYWRTGHSEEYLKHYDWWDNRDAMSGFFDDMDEDE